MFIYTHLLVGPLLPRQSQKLEFPYHDIVITSLAPSCGCTDTTDDKEKQKVKVTVTAPDFPAHLIGKPGMTSKKFILVKYHTVGNENNLKEMKLTFDLSVTNPAFNGR